VTKKRYQVYIWWPTAKKPRQWRFNFKFYTMILQFSPLIMS